MKLNLQSVLITVIPIMIFSIIIVLVVSITISDQLFESTVQKMKILTQFTSSEMKNSVYNLDVDKINEHIDTLELEDTVIQVLVLFPDGRIMTDGTDDNNNFGIVLDDEFVNKSIISNGEQFLIKKEIVRISTPISLNEKIGILVIDFSLKPINIIIQQTYLQISTLSAILIGIFIFVSIFFSRSITLPILKIKTRFEKISKGEYEHSTEKFGITEIQELSNSVNQMNKKLEMFQKEMIKNEKMAVVGELSARISHDLRNAKNGKDAVEQYKLLRPDVVFLDIMMPEYDGIFALQHIREINPEAHVVMVTAYISKEFQNMKKLKPSAIIHKPFDMCTILHILNEQLHLKLDHHS